MKFMNLEELQKESAKAGATLVAVSKTHTPERILEIYEQGQQDFGENKVQELIDKVGELPEDIRWHMIGHLQTNKVRFIAPFISLIHSLDRISLAKEINKQGKRVGRIVPVLLQIKIAREDSKFGIAPQEIDDFISTFRSKDYPFVKIKGVMGMATFTENEDMIRAEFQTLEKIFEHLKNSYFADDNEFEIRSYGMSSDYKIALETGSNMIRIGSLIFGARS